MYRDSDQAPARPRPAAASCHVRNLILIAVFVIGFIGVMGASSIIGFVLSGKREKELIGDARATLGAHVLQQSLIDAETGIRGFLVTGRSEYLQPYFGGLAVLDREGAALLRPLDEDLARADTAAGPQALTQEVLRIRQIWDEVLRLAEDKSLAAAQDLLQQRDQKLLMDRVRSQVATYLGRRADAAAAAGTKYNFERALYLAIDLGSRVIAILGLLYSFRRSVLEIREREAANVANERTGHQMAQLFSLTSVLQSAGDRADAYAALKGAAGHLLPGFSGLLYLMSNSADHLVLSHAWGTLADPAPPERIVLTSCWAMKLGKPHLNDPVGGGLLCTHLPAAQRAALEIPIAARGQVYGMLRIGLGAHAQVAALQEMQSIAVALADAMSLALANLALRDQLQNQALRDPLTGLYNRRFLDEMLAHLRSDTERRRIPLSAIMIDLDHFKRINDQFGHAAGDTVLKETAGAIVQAMRDSDVVCRFGGEELVVLMPDCSLDNAVLKAEQLRLRIIELAPGPVGAVVTASFGVASMPATSSSPSSLMADADEAMYRAKREGRNRVAHAMPRPGAEGAPDPGGDAPAGTLLLCPPLLPAVADVT